MADFQWLDQRASQRSGPDELVVDEAEDGGPDPNASPIGDGPAGPVGQHPAQLRPRQRQRQQQATDPSLSLSKSLS